jgi:hypothetical protein
LIRQLDNYVKVIMEYAKTYNNNVTSKDYVMYNTNFY